MNDTATHPHENSKPVIYYGFTEYVMETGIAYLGINTDRVSHTHPVPFKDGDGIALYLDDGRQSLFLEGQLEQNLSKLVNDPTYAATGAAYVEQPLFLHITHFEQNAVDLYLQKNPRSPLRYEMSLHNKILTPQTVHELFSQQIPAAMSRPVSVTTSSTDPQAPSL